MKTKLWLYIVGIAVDVILIALVVAWVSMIVAAMASLRF